MIFWILVMALHEYPKTVYLFAGPKAYKTQEQCEKAKSDYQKLNQYIQGGRVQVVCEEVKYE